MAGQIAAYLGGPGIAGGQYRNALGRFAANAPAWFGVTQHVYQNAGMYNAILTGATIGVLYNSEGPRVLHIASGANTLHENSEMPRRLTQSGGYRNRVGSGRRRARRAPIRNTRRRVRGYRRRRPMYRRARPRYRRRRRRY